MVTNSKRRTLWSNLLKKDPPPANVEEAMRRQFSAGWQTALSLVSFIMGLLTMAMVATRLNVGSVVLWPTLAALLAATVGALGISLWLPRQAKKEKRLFLGPKQRR